MIICIIPKLKGAKICKEALQTCHKENDGKMRFYFINNKGLQYISNCGKFDTFFDNLKYFYKLKSTKTIVAVFGVDKERNDDLLTIGINSNIWFLHEKDNFQKKEKHITKLFSGVFDLNEEIWKSNAFKWIIKEALSYNESFILLKSNGEFDVFGSSDYEEHKGCFYSNNSYKDLDKYDRHISNFHNHESNFRKTYGAFQCENCHRQCGSIISHLGSQLCMDCYDIILRRRSEAQFANGFINTEDTEDVSSFY